MLTAVMKTSPCLSWQWSNQLAKNYLLRLTVFIDVEFLSSKPPVNSLILEDSGQAAQKFLLLNLATLAEVDEWVSSEEIVVIVVASSVLNGGGAIARNASAMCLRVGPAKTRVLFPESDPVLVLLYRLQSSGFCFTFRIVESDVEEDSMDHFLSDVPLQVEKRVQLSNHEVLDHA
ncbi:hypothetical protein Tco_0857752 [Tanacetum coccineum]|uniref:Uncharacterized protein n=1 Tax=Tanacetum coccineum TaxID=301880 RepID=A0ABQ5B745_9ASTR